MKRVRMLKKEFDRKKGRFYLVTDMTAARMEKEKVATYVDKKEEKEAVETKEEKVKVETKTTKAPK